MKKVLWWCAVIVLCILVGHVSNEMDAAKANNIETLDSISETETPAETEDITKSFVEEEDEDVFYSRCMATTKKGTQCKRSAAKGSHYCYQHR